MNNDDSKLFRDFVGEVEPLNTTRRAESARAPEQTPGARERRRNAEAGRDRSTGNFLDDGDHLPRLDPWDELSFKRDGVQHGVFKNLRLGKYPCEARLDLHRMTVAQARNAVFEFVSDAVAADIRCGLITHGKGQQRQNPAMLKSCVNHWLPQMSEVLAFHSARPEHGGLGACYVLLRKSSRRRQENREIFSKRGTR